MLQTFGALLPLAIGVLALRPCGVAAGRDPQALRSISGLMVSIVAGP